jgi:hypothetical protein
MIVLQDAIQISVAFYQQHWALDEAWGHKGWTWSCPQAVLTALTESELVYWITIQGHGKGGCFRGSTALTPLEIQVHAASGAVVGYRPAPRR